MRAPAADTDRGTEAAHRAWAPKAPGSIVKLLSLGALLCLEGCATLISGQTQEVTFTTYPPGASLAVDGRALGLTPIAVRLERGQYGETLLTKADMDSIDLHLTHSLNGWFWLNVPVVGWLVDWASGAMWNIDPSRYYIPLQRAAVVAVNLRPARDFIAANYKSVMEDLNHGGGPTIKQLFDLIGVPFDNRQDALDLLRTLSTFYHVPGVFAERAAQELVQRGYVDPDLRGQ